LVDLEAQGRRNCLSLGKQIFVLYIQLIYTFNNIGGIIC